MGKGDGLRPRSICGTEYDARWAATFGEQDRHAPPGIRYHVLSGDEIMDLPSSEKNEMGTKHETRTVPCDRCNGTGVIHDMPMDRLTRFDVQSRACPSCLGQGHVEENVE